VTAVATFSLKSGSDTYQFDTAGNAGVRKNGVPFGSWTTDVQNKLIAQSEDGSVKVPFPVTWVFTDKNELCLKSGNDLLCNFHADRRPRYDVVNAVLKVKPDFVAQHQFELRGEWNLTPDMKLTFTTPDNQVSTLDGNLNDLRSRFNYRIASKVSGHESHTAQFLFVGRWRKDPDDPLKLNFVFQRENGTEDVFALAGTVTFNKSDNQMVYHFDGPTRTHQINLIGTLRVSPDFQLSYTIANQVAQGNQTQVTTSEIVIDALFGNSSFDGGLALSVKRAAEETVVNLSGQFTHVRILGGNLGIGFAISGGTGTTPTIVALNGTFSTNAVGELQFTFAKNAKQMTIGISANQIKLGNFATANASGTIRLQDGSLRSIDVMFGVTFPIN
jgi:hypothetical protein